MDWDQYSPTADVIYGRSVPGAHGGGEPAEGDVARGPEGPVGRGGQPALREERRVRNAGERRVDLVDVVHQTSLAGNVQGFSFHFLATPRIMTPM